MSELVKNLSREFKDEEYRYSYDEDFSNSRMATQIKVLREQRELTQSKLAELAGMNQTRISALENVNYSAWSVSTLRRLARALGVRFSFKFEGWGELLRDADRFSRSSLQRLTFEEEFPRDKTEAALKTTVSTGTSQGKLPFPLYLIVDNQITSPLGTANERSTITVSSETTQDEASVFIDEFKSVTTREYGLGGAA